MGIFFAAIKDSDAMVDFLLRIAAFNLRAFAFLFCCLFFLKFFKGSAANRHIFIFLALSATLLLPIASSIAPSVDIVFEVPSSLTENVETISSDTINPGLVQIQSTAETKSFNLLAFVARNIQFIFHTLLALYFLVALSILAKVLISNLRICLITMCAKISYQNNWCKVIDFHRTRFWMSGQVELRHSRHIRSPMTWGLLNPVILIPSSALEWDDDLIKSTVLHELAHIKRNDWITQQLAWCICAMYWINPLTWCSFNRLHAYAETAADDMALRAGVKKSHYAGNLLSVAEKICRYKVGSYAALSMADKSSELSTRITAILNPKGVHTPISSKPLLLALALIFLFLLPLTSIQANYRQKIIPQNNTLSAPISGGDLSQTLLSETDSENDIVPTTTSLPEFLLGAEPVLNESDIGIVIPPNPSSPSDSIPIADTETIDTVANDSLSEKQEEIIEPAKDAQVVKSELLIDISPADALKIAGARLMQSIQGANQPSSNADATRDGGSNKELAKEFPQIQFPVKNEIPHAWNSFAQHSTSQTSAPATRAQTNSENIVSTRLKQKKFVTPRYPNTARLRGIEGEVRVKFNVDKQGKVNQTTIIAASPSGVFDRNVIRALKKSEFQPKTINGQAVSVEGVQEVYRFVLES